MGPMAFTACPGQAEHILEMKAIEPIALRLKVATVCFVMVDVWCHCPPAQVLLYNNVGVNCLPGVKKLSFFPKGTLKQYCISMSNRDPEKFEDPMLFKPERANLHEALTWNGAFKNTVPGEAAAVCEREEEAYPRLCPGRLLAIHTIEAIIDVLLGRE